MWTGQGGAFCGRFQEMLSSWVRQWCWTVLQGELHVTGCDRSYTGLISGSAQGHCLNTGGERGFPFWRGSCRHISPMTPCDSGSLAKPSSASALPYTKAPPFQVPSSIFQFLLTLDPKATLHVLTAMGHGLCVPLGLPWHCGLLAALCKGLQLSRCFLRGCPEPGRMGIFSVSVPLVLWLPAESVVLRSLRQISDILQWCLKIRVDNNRITSNMMVSALTGIKPGYSLFPLTYGQIYLSVNYRHLFLPALL